MIFYFYLPPGDSGLVAQVDTGVFFGGLTAFGAAMLVGRVFDSLADPIVGHLSDRSRSRLGRRRAYLLTGIAPMCGLPVLAFWPPGAPGSLLNWLWLAAILASYFVAFTVYVAPYLALLPEIARSEEARVRIATLAGVLGLPIGGGFAFLWAAGAELAMASGLSPEASIRSVVVVASLLGLALCALPILAIDERRFAVSRASDLRLGQALARTLRNPPFLIHLGAQLFFIFGLNMIQPAIPYIAQVLLGRSLGFAAVLGGVLGAGIVVGFAVVPALSRRLGTKRSLIACVALFALALGSLWLVEADVPGGPRDAHNLAVVFVALAAAGLPVSGFVVLPPVLLGQIIDVDEQRTGASRSAIYFGVQGLATKWMYGISSASLAFLLARHGHSQAEPLGVWLVAPVAGAACLLSALLYGFYPEQAVLRAVRTPPPAPASGR